MKLRQFYDHRNLLSNVRAAREVAAVIDHQARKAAYAQAKASLATAVTRLATRKAELAQMWAN